MDLLLYSWSEVSSTNLPEYRQSLQYLHLWSKQFACSYATTDSRVIDDYKNELFQQISEYYKNQDFAACDWLLCDYLENTNFKNGEYFDDYQKKMYSSYANYVKAEEERIQRETELYDQRIKNGECVCDLTSGEIPVTLLLDCPLCKKPYNPGCLTQVPQTLLS